MKRSLFIILGALCFAIAGKAQGSDVSVQKKNTGYRILNDTVEAVKDSMTFEQRVEMINRMKLKQDTKLLRYVAGITGGLCDSNENSYMVELTFAYYPLTYAGVSCGIEWNDNHGDRPLIERYEDDEYDPKRIIQINLTPGLAFRTPTRHFIMIGYLLPKSRMHKVWGILHLMKMSFMVMQLSEPSVIMAENGWLGASSRL